MNPPLIMIWWRLALMASEEDMNSRYYKSKQHHCKCAMCRDHLLRNGCVFTHSVVEGVSVTVVVLPLKHKCCQKRRVKFILHSSGSVKVITLLLMLAGDVETNPGPGIVYMGSGQFYGN